MALLYGTRRDPRLVKRAVISATAISGASEQEAAVVPATLSPQAISAMTDPLGISPLLDAALEIESNRLQRSTTTVLRRADTLAAVGVLDPATMTVASLSTGRRNPTRRFAVADVSVADDAVVFDTDGTEETPVAFADPMTLTDEIVGGYPAAGDAAWTWTGAASTTQSLPATSSSYSGGTVLHRLTRPGGLGAGVLASASKPVAFWQGGGAGGRLFTASLAVRLTTALGAGVHTLTCRLRSTVVTTAGTSTLYGPTVTLSESSASVGSWQRLVAPLTTAASATDLTITGVTLELEVFASSNLGEIDLDAGEWYAGPDRGPLVGRRAAIPSVAGSTVLAVVEQTWTGTRQVNRVELAGERRLGRISSAHVDVLDDADGTWKTVGSAGGPGRLAVLFPVTYTARGVRVYVEEATAGPGGRVWVSEVDPMLVADVTDDVQAAGVKWARDAASSGAATNPYGNYQGATASVTLDNTSGAYTPAKNASLGAGHRLELGVGARWSNLIGNPRADVNLSGEIAAYTNGGATFRAYPAPPGGPAATAIARTTTGPGGVGTGWRVPVVSGRTYRARLFVKVESADPTAYAFASQQGMSIDGATGMSLPVAPVQQYPADGWRLQTLPPFTFTPPSGAGIGYVDVVANVQQPGAIPATLYATCAVLEELDAVTGLPIVTEELLPAGVFYAEPWAAPSDSTTVSIDAADKLGRFAGTTIDEPVRVGATTDLLIRDLALAYLDLDDDQVAVAASPGAYTIPYAYPSGNLGSYLADLAKASLATMYLDPAERLILSPVGFAVSAPVAEIRADNALIRSTKPNAVDTTTSIVTVTANPLALGTITDLWSLPSGGVTIPAGASRTIFVDYSSAPAINVFLTSVTADQAYTVATAFYADHAFLTVTNPNASTLTVTTAIVRGNPLTEQPLTTQLVDGPSRARFGPRELKVDARLVQTQQQLDTVAAVLLDAYKALDSAGLRRLPTVELDSLGLLHVDLDDVVTVVDPAIGVGADYLLTSREVSFESGRLLTLNATGQQAPTVSYGIADTSLADDVFVTGY